MQIEFRNIKSLRCLCNYPIRSFCLFLTSLLFEQSHFVLWQIFPDHFTPLFSIGVARILLKEANSHFFIRASFSCRASFSEEPFFLAHLSYTFIKHTLSHQYSLIYSAICSRKQQSTKWLHLVSSKIQQNILYGLHPFNWYSHKGPLKVTWTFFLWELYLYPSFMCFWNYIFLKL